MSVGCAADADICLETLPEHYARIEHKPDGYYIISLDSSAEVVVNGTGVTFQRLRHGDKLAFGGFKAVLLSDEEAVHEEPIHHDPMPVAIANAHSPVPMGAARCPYCGMPVTPGIPSCPHCGMQLSSVPAMPMGFIPPVPAGQVGVGILPIIAFLAALSVVGAPIALVLGLMTLSVIRKRGGTVRDRSLAKWSIGLGMVWLMLGAAGAVLLAERVQKREQLNVVEEYEAQTIRALKNLACAQKYAHTIEFFDADSDGHGEYGSLSALADTTSPFFDTDLADGDAYGYAFVIRETSEGQFLAVAEPARYGETGIRTFVMDQNGQIRGGDAEGKRFGQIEAVLPVLQGERSAYYEVDDEIAKDVLGYIKTLSSELADQEKKQRILNRLRQDYALTSVGRELEGTTASVDRFVSEQHAQTIYLDARAALAENKRDVALAKLMEIQEKHPSFSEIAAVDRELGDLRSEIAQQREQSARQLFAQAEELERQGQQPQEVQSLYQRIEKLYPDTDMAARISSLKPELQRQLRESSAENIFSDLMELSPERDFEEILNRANQLRRNYKDTDLFSKVQTELAEKERKARASSWRVKTEQNMAADRMRGALAQLESAARENPDLLYDLRDLCITLYRSVADTLMEEGDARKALVYYEKLSGLLQASGAEDRVSPDLLAQLHNNVGQADFGLKKYGEARWHFSSAAWKYQQDASFNMRLGAANLYTGLYRPAETAFARSLSARADMTPVLLYRAYLNLRVVSSLEKVLAGGFKQNENPQSTGGEGKAADPQPSNLIVSVDNVSEDEDDEITVNTTVTSGDATIAAPQSLDLQSSGLRANWFSRFADAQLDGTTSVPGPADLNLFLNFNYSESSSIILATMQFLQELDLQQIEKALAESTGRFNAQSQSKGQSDARKMGRMQVKASEQRNTAEFHTQLRNLRAFHLEDIDSRQELYDLMDQIKQRLRAAKADIQLAGIQQPQILSLTENVQAQITAKFNSFSDAEKMICGSMKEELVLRKQMMELAEEMLLDNFSSSFKREVSRFRNKLFEDDSVIEINPALRALRDSMDVRIDLDNILRAAEGYKPTDRSVLQTSL
jgi:hypothetical protein